MDSINRVFNEQGKELKRNKIYPRKLHLYKGQFYIHSLNMDEEIAKKVGDKLLRILKS